MCEEPNEQSQEAREAEPTVEEEAPAADSDASPAQDLVESDEEAAFAKPVFTGKSGTDVAQVWVSAFLIVVVGIIAFSNTFALPFHAEDRRVIAENEPLHRLGTFPQAMAAHRGAPLPMLTYALTWRVFGGKPAPFHAMNIVLHLTCGVLVYLLCRKLLTRKAPEAVSMLAGLLFVVHPANTETVNYIVGRDQLLATVFVIAGILLFLRAFRGYDNLRSRTLCLSFMVYLMGWACNIDALVLPVLILAVDWLRNGREGVSKRFRIHSAYWALMSTLVVVTAVSGASPDAALLQSSSAFSFTTRVVAMGALLKQGLLAIGLNVYHDLPASSVLLLVTGALGLIVLFLVAFIGLGRRSLPGLAATWALLALVLAVGMRTRNPLVSEQALYPVLAGLVLVVPWLFSRLGRTGLRVLAGLVAAGLVFAGAGATLARNSVWRDEEALWKDAVEKSPNTIEPQRRLGHYFFKLGETALREAKDLPADQEDEELALRQSAQFHLQSAEGYLRETIARAPDDAEARFYLGLALRYLGKKDEGIQMILSALPYDLDNPVYTVELARALHSDGRATGDHETLVRAVDYFRRADALGGLSGSELVFYADTLAFLGSFEESERIYQRVAVTQSASGYEAGLAKVREVAVQVRQLEQEEARLRKRDPTNTALIGLRAQALVLRGEWLQAAYRLDELLRKDPNDSKFWVLLGYVKARMKEEEAFLADWHKAPLVEEGDAQPYVQLARTCASASLWGAAERYLSGEEAKASGVQYPLIWLAEMAIEFNKAQHAGRYLEEAAAAYPSSPGPWLRLFDMAADRAQYEKARTCLEEAKKRQAKPEDIAPRAKRLSDSSSSSGGGTATVKAGGTDDAP